MRCAVPAYGPLPAATGRTGEPPPAAGPLLDLPLLQGSIDEVPIRARALTDDEVRAAYGRAR